MSKYPEHDKLSAVSDKSQVIGEFLEWLEYGSLDDGGLDEHVGPVLLAFRPLVADVHPGRTAPHGERVRNLQPLDWEIEKLLATYFEIDLGRIEEEKREMIAKLDEMNTGTSTSTGTIAEADEDLIPAIRAVAEAGHPVHIPQRPGKVTL